MCGYAGTIIIEPEQPKAQPIGVPDILNRVTVPVRISYNLDGKVSSGVRSWEMAHHDAANCWETAQACLTCDGSSKNAKNITVHAWQILVSWDRNMQHVGCTRTRTRTDSQTPGGG